ncbi:hypothetical protein GCM10010168_75310 [Actinoplanes ianthinogenes]|uniref:DUF4142 domain-containing protein n=1 Tax=Actinoplanes ianthinogenes TaxID=122358 RepID=A0ABM7LRG5_9ACTN|nr:DUF4142 domain-containing protein [Actinoplanes ianthinogenes]BCJ41843.1 hypothetical protein Aiant_25000 [Actinoplanes ianthinogenes]GGR45503.1 hypothetical protein GCM10010168_75310 [Actinoplanes ianthinogenes]
MIFRRMTVALGAAGLLLLPAVAAQAAGSSDRDIDFLRAAHQANLAEIAGGRIAFQKTADPAVKKIAADLMRDHIFMDADLSATARKLRISLPMTPTAEQQALARRYEAAGTDTFDEYYISTQLAAHREAHEMAAAQAEQGDQEAVTDLAEKAVPIISRHQQELRQAAEAKGIAGYAGAGGRAG